MPRRTTRSWTWPSRYIGAGPPACRDPQGDYVVASAIAGRADFAVTLDDDLFALAEDGGVCFVKPRGALAILREAGSLSPE